MKSFQSAFTIPSFLLYVVGAGYTAWSTITHQNTFESYYGILIFSVIMYLVFIFLGLMEIYGSKAINKNEKFMWTIGFVFMTLIAGIAYLIVGRKRVLKDAHLVNRENSY